MGASPTHRTHTETRVNTYKCFLTLKTWVERRYNHGGKSHPEDTHRDKRKHLQYTLKTCGRRYNHGGKSHPQDKRQEKTLTAHTSVSQRTDLSMVGKSHPEDTHRDKRKHLQYTLKTCGRRYNHGGKSHPQDTHRDKRKHLQHTLKTCGRRYNHGGKSAPTDAARQGPPYTHTETRENTYSTH